MNPAYGWYCTRFADPASFSISQTNAITSSTMRFLVQQFVRSIRRLESFPESRYLYLHPSLNSILTFTIPLTKMRRNWKMSLPAEDSSSKSEDVPSCTPPKNRLWTRIMGYLAMNHKKPPLSMHIMKSLLIG